MSSCHNVCVEVRNQRSFFPFYYALSGDQTTVVNLGSKCVCPLNHLAIPPGMCWNLFFFCVWMTEGYLRGCDL